MSLADPLLRLAVLASLVAAGSAIAALRLRGRRSGAPMGEARSPAEGGRPAPGAGFRDPQTWDAVAAWSAVASALATLACFLWLLSRFILSDVSIEYVHLYTHADLPLRWRIAGTWTGRQGSLLLWLMWGTLALAVLAWRLRITRRAPSASASSDPSLRPAASAASTSSPSASASSGAPPADAGAGVADPGLDAHRATVAVFALLLVPLQLALLWKGTWGSLLTADPFGPTPDWLLAGRPLGSGLNPTLRSPFILVHPPLMFLAYALAAVPAAAGIAHLVRGDGQWSRIGLSWSRVDWIVYTVAIGLGSMWAYVTLNFGGYWAWDPVEVANLLPWLALTLFLHAQTRHVRHGAFAQTGPLLATLPWILTLFSTFSTRSGLWVSVHAFTDPSNTFSRDPARRLLDILAADASLLPLAALLLGLPALVLALWTRRTAADLGTLPRVALAVSAVLAAWTGLALAAPHAATSLLLEAGSRLGGGNVGYGLFALVFAVTTLAAAPILAAPGAPPRPWRRLGHGTLASVAVALLGAGLLVLWLFHMSAVRGWSQAFYESRFPWIAAPGVLALVLFQSRSAYGPRRAWQVLAIGAVLWIAAAVAWDGTAGLLAASILFLATSLDNLRRNVAGKGREGTGHALLVLGALLDVLWWVDPPSSLGVPLAGRLALLTLSVYALCASVALAAGASWVSPPDGRHGLRRMHVFLLVGLLGGFLVAPVLAAAGWLLSTFRTGKGRLGRQAARTRLRAAALHGLHLGVALVIVGYGLSTGLREEAEATVPGEALQVAGIDVKFEGARLPAPDGLFASSVLVDVEATRGTSGLTAPSPRLEWEAPIGAYVPHPAILRLWDRDVYFAVDAVTVDPSGTCFASGEVAAYAPTERICRGDEVTAARIRVVSLPGMDLLWGGVIVLAAAGTLLLAQGPRPRP